MIRILKTFLSCTTELFFPNICVSCGQHISQTEEVLCTICALRLPYTNFHLLAENPLMKKFWGRVNLQTIDSLLYFEKASRTQVLLYNLKYNARQDIGTKLAQIIIDKYLANNQAYRYDAILSVPLHAKKLKRRGFNQCDTFAIRLAQFWEIPYYKDALVRNIDNESQTGKNRILRWENVADIFKVRNPEQLKNKHLLLVDDVLTTGATLEACAIKLLCIEHTKVSVLTMACKI